MIVEFGALGLYSIQRTFSAVFEALSLATQNQGVTA
jgi:hypothetical protein